VSDYSALSTDELRKMHGWFEHEVYNLEHEIKERTSPWPWPKTSRFMARLWAGELIRIYRAPLTFDNTDRARPNSGE
jgi:hypothetical protein